MQFEKLYNNPGHDADVLEEGEEDLDLEAAHHAADRLIEKQKEDENKRIADLIAEQEQADKEELDRLYNDKDVMGDIFPYSRKLRGLEDKD